MVKQQHNLSPAENLRRERFGRLCVKMQEAGFEAHDCTGDALKVSTWALLLKMPFAILAIWLYLLVNPPETFFFTRHLPLWGLLLLFLCMLPVLAMLHSLIHGLVWSIFTTRHLHSICFQFERHNPFPCCICMEPLGRWQYVLGLLMPTLVLGYGFAIASVLFAMPVLLALSLVMILAGGMDLYPALKILGYKNTKNTVLFCDHPIRYGFWVFEKDQ